MPVFSGITNGVDDMEANRKMMEYSPRDYESGPSSQRSSALSNVTEDLKITTPKSGPQLLIEYALALGMAAIFLALCADVVIFILRWVL